VKIGVKLQTPGKIARVFLSFCIIFNNVISN
jgi:hypothetical protein